MIEEFLPKQISLEDIEEKARIVISDLGVKDKSEIGKVMKVLSKELFGLADGKAIMNVVINILS